MADEPPTPLRQHTGSLANTRLQSDLKPLIQLEVADLVFESESVPSIFFGPARKDLEALIPTEIEVKPLLVALKACKGAAEKHTYDPLEELLTLIVDPPKSSPRHRTPPVRIRFRVYTKVMDNAYDGRGKLKPDVLGGDRRHMAPSSKGPDLPLHWRVVWISIEVKGMWPEALQQVLTYARSMLEVGDKWFAVVLVYNQTKQSARLCFATRHAVFVTPAWRLSIRQEFTQFASALLHACHAHTDSIQDAAHRSAAGYDSSRVLGSDGTLYFTYPQLGTFKHVREIFGFPRVSGRATHVYEITVDALPVTKAGDAIRDPPNLQQKLVSCMEQADPMLSGGLPQAQQTRTLRSETTKTKRELVLSSVPVPVRELDFSSRGSDLSRAMPSDTEPESSLAPAAGVTPPGLEPWEYYCTNWTSDFLEGAVKYILTPKRSIVAKYSWAPYERLNIEIVVLKKVVGRFGFVRYLGHVTIPHVGMERLAHFAKASATEDWRCQDWPNVYTSQDVELVLFRRVDRVVFYSNTGSSLITYAHDIIVVAFSLKDAYIALYTLFTLGYLHRDPSIGNILTLEKYVRITDAERGELRGIVGDELFRKWSSMLELQRAFLCDFDQAVEWKEERKHLPGRSGTPAFLASARSTAWVLQIPFLETLPDDLESATWTGFYSTLRVAINAKNKPSPLQIRHYESFNGDDAYIITAAKEWILKLATSSTIDNPTDTTNISEEERVLQLALGETWPLWRRLFRAAADSRAEIDALKMELPEGKNFCTAGEVLQKKLEEVCKNALLRYLGAVFDPLQEAPFAGMMPRFDEFTTGNAGAPGTPDAPAPGSASDPDGGNAPAPPGAAGAPGASQPPAPAPPSAPRGAQSTSAPSKGGKSSAASNPPPKKSSNRNKNAPSNVQDIFNP